MAAIVTFVMSHIDSGEVKTTQFSKDFFVGDKPSNRWPGIKPKNIECIELSEEELEYAIQNLGAAPINKPSVMYFGDEANRIYFNW